MNIKKLSSGAGAESALAFATLLWGLTFVVIKTGLGDASPLFFLCLRFSVAFIPYFLFYRKRFRNLSGRTVMRASVLALFFFSGYAMQTIGLKYTTIAKSSLFTYLFAVFVPPLQYFFTGKKPKIVNVAALIVVFFGMMLFASPGRGGLNVGDWITIIGAAGYSFFIIFVDRFTGEEDPVVLTGFQFGICAVLAGLLSVFLEDTFVTPTLSLTLSILYLAVPGSIIGVGIVNKFQGGTSPVKACLIYALEPVFSIIFGWLILKETLTVMEFCGTLLIISGVVFAEVIGVIRKKRTGAKTNL